MTTVGSLPAAAYFNYRWRLELEFAPYTLFNSVRSRTSAAGRPLLRAEGQSYRNSYVLPAVAVNELAIYLIGRNYMLRRKTSQKTIPAEAMGLVAPSAAGLDLLDRAWNFRLGIAQARRISRWRRE